MTGSWSLKGRASAVQGATGATAGIPPGSPGTTGAVLRGFWGVRRPAAHAWLVSMASLAVAWVMGACTTVAAAPLQPGRAIEPGQTPEGVSRTDWDGIRAAHEAWRHSFHPVEGGWQARNPGQRWTAWFDGRGFMARPREGLWTWGVELASYGMGDYQQAVGMLEPTTSAQGQRLASRWDGTIEEWWVNDTRGLEHGFTLHGPPSGWGEEASGPVRLLLRTRGELLPEVMEDARGVRFNDGQGVAVVNYGGLRAWDADGRDLAARFEAGEAGYVWLQVETEGARYPVTIDPIAQQAYLKQASDVYTEFQGDQFGASVSVSTNTVVVGAPFEDSSTTGVDSSADNAASGSGAAYVFVRSGTTWIQQAYLKAGNTGAGDGFGTSVSVDGDTVVVGAPYEDSSTTGVGTTSNESASDSGAAYVFVRGGTTWSQQAYLKAGNTGAGDGFGTSVSVDGDTVVVGATGEDSSKTGVGTTPDEGAANSGAAYVFLRSGTAWSQQAYLKASNTGAADLFGSSVSVSGDTVVVGAPEEDSNTTGVNSTTNESAAGAGAAYVFVRSGTAWSQQAYLKAGNAGAGDHLGGSVSVSGDTVVVGATGEDSSTTGSNSTPDESAADSGAAYVFVRSWSLFTGTFWAQQAYLKAGNTGANDGFGSSVSVSGSTVVVGAPFEDSSTTGSNSTPNESASNAGAVYVFVSSWGLFTGTTWSQQAYLKTSSSGASDTFGSSVSVSGTTVIVGAPGGRASWAFVSDGTSWTQQRELNPTQKYPDSGDLLGSAVSVSGDTVVVGAPKEDSSTTGVNTTPNQGAADSGAAYVFVRSGNTWSQQAYLKAGNAGAGDQFGISVSVSGDTVVVGALNEDSSTTGVNSTPNEGASDSGAVYVFVRSGTTWSQEAYLKAGNAGAGDEFGISVSMSGDTVVVGAHQEDSSTTEVNSTPNEGAPNSGAAYVFVRSGTIWSQQAYLKAGNTGEGDRFGRSVSVDGDTVVVGASGEDSGTTGVNSTPNENAGDSGAAYVFVRTVSTWSQQAYLKAHFMPLASARYYWNGFGISVSVSRDTVVVGWPGEESNGTGVNPTPGGLATHNGAAYVFVRSGTNWSQQAFLKARYQGSGRLFGASVSVSGDILVVGATGASLSGSAFSTVGAVEVFTRSGTTWSQNAYLNASNSGQGDQFGTSVSISGNTVVVGASWEDSGTTGVNSTPNEGSENSGAAYVFTGFYDAPSVGTATSASITSASATLGGDIIADGGAAVTERGVVYSLTSANADPSIGGSGVTKLAASGTGTGIFTVAVNGLAAGSGYTFKAYAINSPGSMGTVYSSASSFNTLSPTAAPSVGNPTSASIAAAGASLGGNVTADGGDAVTERGVVYSLTSVNANPAIGGAGVTKVAASGTGMGVFTVAVNALAAGSGYTFKAYAINSVGTSYSSAASFTTLSQDALLSGLSISGAGGALSPAFSGTTTSYTLERKSPVDSVTVTPTASQGGATLRVRLNGGVPASVTSGSASAPLSLNAGLNTVEVEVTAEDGLTTRTYTVNVTRLSRLLTWKRDNFDSIADSGNSADAASPAGDGLSNLAKFAYGLDPTQAASGPLVISGNTIVSRGKPTVAVVKTATSVGYRARYLRRKDATTVDNLAFEVQFSADISTWHASSATPVVVASDAEYEVVEVPYPLFLNGRKAGFFRVNVDHAGND